MADPEPLSDRPPRLGWLKLVALGVLAMGLGAGVTLGAVLGVADVFGPKSWPGEGDVVHPTASDDEVELFRDAAGRPGLRLTAEAVSGHGIRPVPAVKAEQERALPPQVGTLNYDNDRLFNIRTRFPGELAEMMMVTEPGVPTVVRPLRFGDKVEQGARLAVVWSQQLGQAKAALVDAICAQRLSKDNYDRLLKLWQDGNTSVAALKQAERQLQQDSGTLVSAERSLKMWKLTSEEIQEIRKEADKIIDHTKVRNSDLEAKWAVVEIKVPPIPDNPSALLTVIEKNTCLNDMLDPINSPAPLFKVADLSRLMIWVHPPEEYLPVLRANLARAQQEGRPLEWAIRFKSDPEDAPPQKMKIVQIAPSIEPYQHTPMVVGYLDNSKGKYLVGQFVTATIFVPPAPDTVEIPPDALNEVGGQALVFVESNAAKREYTLRRVAVVARFKDAIIVRSKLTAEDEKVSRQEQEQGRRPIEPLRPGERVITRGVVELTTALEGLLVEERAKAELSR
jgi:cobalt-zinc-cadmium efflux system membrane fusion protein